MIASPTVVSLFTGAGGLDLGFEKAGYDIRVCVEIDPISCRTLRRNRPNWKVIEDNIRDVSTSQILQKGNLSVGEASFLTAGPPCQPFSTLGNRKALKDPRGVLLREFIRVLNQTQPRAYLFENVLGLVSVNGGRVLEEIVQAIRQLGYAANPKILNSADYGVPQLRKRLFIVGSREGFYLEFPPADHSKDGRGGKKKWINVAEAFERMRKEGWDATRRDNRGFRHSPEMVKKMSFIKPGGNFRQLPKHLLPSCWKSGKHQGRDTFGRIEADKPSPTIRTSAYNPTKGRYIHPYEDRGLSTLEMAVLQTFPKDYVFEGSLVSIGKQIGDAVPPLLAEKMAMFFKKQLFNKSLKPEERDHTLTQSTLYRYG